jgi:hypothetical protein
VEENKDSPEPLVFRSGFQIFSAQLTECEKIMNSLSEKVPTQLVILLEKSGQIISHIGKCDRFDLIAFGSLISADLAASKAIAEYSEEYQETQTILREGKFFDSLICEASEHLILFVQFSTQISLGWARLLVKNAVIEISKVVLTQPAENPPEESKPPEDNNLMDVIDDRLKEIWKQ